MSRQPSKKWKYRIILIFLCAAIGGWFGWWLRTAVFLPQTPPLFRDWDSSIVVCALIAGLVGCVPTQWIK
ncbi:uncharacterized protein METZ01_LOCUS434279 [marine metagenome]|uniref:Uncharacterized protein n=1 Tax=marine metagenome TaxID=408172 RepID=A0A382YF11_9ZZZZ